MILADHLRPEVSRVLSMTWDILVDAPQRRVWRDRLSGQEVEIVLYGNGEGTISTQMPGQPERRLDIAPRKITSRVLSYLL